MLIITPQKAVFNMESHTVKMNHNTLTYFINLFLVAVTDMLSTAPQVYLLTYLFTYKTLY